MENEEDTTTVVEDFDNESHGPDFADVAFVAIVVAAGVLIANGTTALAKFCYKKATEAIESQQASSLEVVEQEPKKKDSK